MSTSIGNTPCTRGWFRLRDRKLAVKSRKSTFVKNLFKLAQPACMHHACLHAPCVAWSLLLPSFSLSSLLFLRKKKQIFRPIFCFLRPAFGHGRLGHPQSLEYHLLFCVIMYCLVLSWIIMCCLLLSYIIIYVLNSSATTL